jgi:cytochrome P450
MTAVAPRTITGPEGYPFIGVFPKLKKDALGFFKQTARDHGGIALLDFGRRQVFLVTDPDCIKHILQDNYRNYIRGSSVSTARLLLGNGLALNNGESWLRQRRLMQPAFHRQRLDQLSQRIVELTEETAVRWQQYAASGQAVDVNDEMMKLTLQIVVKSMFSEDISDRLDELSHAFDIAQHFIYWYRRNPLAMPLWLPTPANRRFLQARKQVDKIIYDLIAKRRQQPNEANDLLDMLLAARDEETGEGMSDEQLRDEIVTIFFAGHETTVTMLTWTWYILTTNSQAEADLQAELTAVLHGNPPSFSDLPQLDYTERLLYETMRIYTPTWIFAREAVADDVVQGYALKAGSSLLISSYVTHHNPEFWPQPETFDPDRFLPENVASRHRYAYLPFGAGPHLCIGKGFAMMEAQLIMGLLAQRFRLELVPNHPIEMAPQVTLRPKHGMMMTIHLR